MILDTHTDMHRHTHMHTHIVALTHTDRHRETHGRRHTDTHRHTHEAVVIALLYTYTYAFHPPELPLCFVRMYLPALWY